MPKSRFFLVLLVALLGSSALYSGLRGERRQTASHAPAPVVRSPIAPGVAVSGPVYTPEPVAPAPVTSDAAPVPTKVLGRMLCHNSTDPRCGSFFWSPAPGSNRPVRVSVTWWPKEPVAGDEVTYVVTVDDPDAEVVAFAPWLGDGKRVIADRFCHEQARYGAWTLPAPVHGHRTYTLTHVYAKAGTYRPSFAARTGSECAPNPYASSVTLDMSIKVTPGTVASPEPTDSVDPSPSPDPSDTPSPSPSPES